jgi:hypothetical protein
MNAAEQLREVERLTWPEICSRYPDQYVCLIEVDRLHPRDLDFRTARVVGHGKTRREALDQAFPFCDTDTEIAFRFTGQIKYVRPALILDDQTRDAIRSRG